MLQLATRSLYIVVCALLLQVSHVVSEGSALADNKPSCGLVLQLYPTSVDRIEWSEKTLVGAWEVCCFVAGDALGTLLARSDDTSACRCFHRKFSEKRPQRSSFTSHSVTRSHSTACISVSSHGAFPALGWQESFQLTFCPFVLSLRLITIAITGDCSLKSTATNRSQCSSGMWSPCSVRGGRLPSRRLLPRVDVC